jgi:uncharacterized protein
MKNERVFKITGYFVTIILILSLPTGFAAAQTALTPDDQFIRAVARGGSQRIEMLLDKGANVNARDQYGSTALIGAVYWGDPKTVGLLLRKGADLNAKVPDGRTALMEVAARDHQIRKSWWYEFRHAVETRLRYGGWGPSHPDGPFDAEIAKLLLKNGADVNATDKTGWTALKRAQNRGHTEIVALLKAHGAKE